MTIKDCRQNSTKFESVSVGECFAVGKDVFMKTLRINYEDVFGVGKANAININEGILCFFSKDFDVSKVECTLVVESPQRE